MNIKRKSTRKNGRSGFNEYKEKIKKSKEKIKKEKWELMTNFFSFTEKVSEV